MTRRLTMLALLLATTISTAGAAPSCQFDAVAAGSGEIGRWIDRDNWLAVDNQRVSLQAADVFMPARRLRPAAGGEALRAAPRPLDIDRLETTDPFDGRKRDLGPGRHARYGQDHADQRTEHDQLDHPWLGQGHELAHDGRLGRQRGCGRCRRTTGTHCAPLTPRTAPFASGRCRRWRA